MTAQSSGGDIRRTVILNPQLNWSEEEIRQALERLNALPDPARSDEEDLWSSPGGTLRLFAELSDSRRAEAAAIIQNLQEAMQSGMLNPGWPGNGSGSGSIWKSWNAGLSGIYGTILMDSKEEYL